MKFKEFISLLENTPSDVEKPLTSKDILNQLKELTKGPSDPHYGGLPNMPGKYVARTPQDDKAAELAKQYLDALDRERKLGESVEHLSEVLSKSAPIEDWIHDFVHSDNPKFKGKTKEERRKMAIAAYYAAHGKAKESQNESIELQIESIFNNLHNGTIIVENLESYASEKHLNDLNRSIKNYQKIGGAEPFYAKLEDHARKIAKDSGKSIDTVSQHINDYVEHKLTN